MIEIKNLLIDLLFPGCCVSCGHEGNCLCDRCIEKIKISKNPDPVRIPAAHPLMGVWIAADYDDEIIAAAIKAFKYQLLPDLGDKLAGLMSAHLSANESFRTLKFDHVVPVPLSRRRLNWRGFNQSEILGAALCRRLNRRFACNLLRRIRYTHPQVGLPAAERFKNIRGIFTVSPEYEIAGTKILLLDDVVTSGATLGECARILVEAGAKEVWAAVVAKG